MLLETKDLTKHFDGLTAVNGVNLAVEEGQIHSIIGPNGAGKTTLFNMLTGEISVSAGEILFQGNRITGTKPHHIARNHIGRSFQLNRLFKNLTVMENIRLAAHIHCPGRFNIIRHALGFNEPIEKAERIMEQLDMTDLAAKKAGELPHGQQRILEVALALAAEPVLLLLDEPTSGMSPDDAVRMIGLLRKIGQSLTMVIIEHNMNLVMAISSVITVLQQGQVLASDAPAEIRKNPEVRKAYLGGHA